MANEGANIICLPELFATGYDLVELKGKIVDLSREYFEKIKDEMSECAKKNNVYLIAPFGEIREHYSKIFNSAFVYDCGGKCLGTYAKTHLWELEKLYFEKGSDLPVFETKFGKIGVQICYDAGFPEASRVLCLKGAEIVLYPSAWRIEDEDIYSGCWTIYKCWR